MNHVSELIHTQIVEGGGALQSAKNGPVIAIFVGTSVELFKGKYLVFLWKIIPNIHVCVLFGRHW
jgi:hypothetical protein